jgi:hypothetical protein
VKNEQSTANQGTATSLGRSGCARASRKSVPGNAYLNPVAWLPQVTAVIASLLREVFDEAAYRRFLERNRISSSTAAYAAFREENDRWKARRPKCC